MEETSDVKQQVYFVADMMLNIQCLLETIQFKSYSFKILKSIGNLKCKVEQGQKIRQNLIPLSSFSHTADLWVLI